MAVAKAMAQACRAGVGSKTGQDSAAQGQWVMPLVSSFEKSPFPLRLVYDSEPVLVWQVLQ